MIRRSFLASLSFLVAIAGTTVVAQPLPPAPGPPPVVAPPGWVFAPPTPVPYRPGGPVPPGYHLESRPRKGMVWTGAIMFGATYALLLTTTLGNADGNGKWNLIPFAGPALYAHSQKCASPCDDIGTPIFTVFFTGAEVVGAALFASGYLFPRPWLVPDQPRVAAGRGPTITLLPLINRLGASLAAVGTF